ncbi:MAG: acetyl-CoA carboxylase biotin carboxyl carrier protein subunit [Alphaproteobacteria bacterium]|jgi:acetyl-CoA carboxylase biotin carboxyl carrier protein|nr:acetyl-CoA carboxylase biotin carboxyl carrier protein subunit [Alphaproteobacteria bacterium]MDP6515621.1 acetyl-CoA carboxylase biotin carboxyl carrier protein subunit [Alphaproteobacteria bacterium]
MVGKLDVDDGLIRRLAALLEETGLSEIEVRQGSRQVRVARNNPAAAPPPAAPTPAAPVAPSPARNLEVDASHPGAVPSPMVGTVYLAGEPGATPFVAAGDSVKAGDTMFIIEAMKTMNPVRAPRDGRVVRILVDNGTPVEYGEVLALLE